VSTTRKCHVWARGRCAWAAWMWTRTVRRSSSHGTVAYQQSCQSRSAMTRKRAGERVAGCTLEGLV